MRPLVILLACGALGAAELQVSDLRLVAEARPTGFDATWEDRLGSRSGAGSFSGAWAGGAGARWGFGPAGRPWQVLVGAEALYLDERAPGSAGSGALARAEAGLGWALGHRLALTVLPLAGWGRMRQRLTVPGAADLDLTGPLSEYGLRAGLRWQALDRLALGAEAGWLASRERLSGDGARLTLESSGAWAGLSLAWVFEQRPRTLE
jgi:hypothetical protein